MAHFLDYALHTLIVNSYICTYIKGSLNTFCRSTFRSSINVGSTCTIDTLKVIFHFLYIKHHFDKTMNLPKVSYINVCCFDFDYWHLQLKTRLEFYTCNMYIQLKRFFEVPMFNIRIRWLRVAVSFKPKISLLLCFLLIWINPVAWITYTVVIKIRTTN
jgi:hypothetical protein